MTPTSNDDSDLSGLNTAIDDALSTDVEQVYAKGYQAFQNGLYDCALIDFSWLVMSQPWSWRAHIALAGALRMTRDYQAAINFYSYALMLDSGHPEPVYQMGVCLQAMGQLSDARMVLQSAISMSYDNAAYSTVGVNAQTMLNQLLV